MLEPGVHLHHSERLGGELELAGDRDPHVWTAPRTWVAGEVLTASLLNTHLRDQMLWLGETDARLSAPPGSPRDGQIWVYPADAANGIYWAFRYVAALTAWVFQGGPPLVSRVLGPAASSTSTVYVDVASGASITVARAGIYLCRAGATGGQTVGSTAWISLAAGATATDSSVVWNINMGNGSTGYATITSGSIAAASVIRFQQKNTGGGSGGTVQASNMNLDVTPVRVT